MDLNPNPTPIHHNKKLEFEDGAKTEMTFSNILFVQVIIVTILKPEFKKIQI